MNLMHIIKITIYKTDLEDDGDSNKILAVRKLNHEVERKCFSF